MTITAKSMLNPAVAKVVIRRATPTVTVRKGSVSVSVPTSSTGQGNVSGPDGAVVGHLAMFDNATGRHIADSGIPSIEVIRSTGGTMTAPLHLAGSAIGNEAISFEEVDAMFDAIVVPPPPPQTITLTGDVTGSGTDTITATVIEANVDHSLLANYSANQHVDHTLVSVSPGVGLTGGGTIDVTRTLTVDQSIIASKTYVDGKVAAVPVYTHPNHSGDVTSVGDGATAIAPFIVEQGDMADTGFGNLIGNPSFTKSPMTASSTHSWGTFPAMWSAVGRQDGGAAAPQNTAPTPFMMKLGPSASNQSIGTPSYNECRGAEKFWVSCDAAADGTVQASTVSLRVTYINYLGGSGQIDTFIAPTSTWTRFEAQVTLPSSAAGVAFRLYRLANSDTSNVFVTNLVMERYATAARIATGADGPAFTGDVTKPAGSNATTIAAEAVIPSKLDIGLITDNLVVNGNAEAGLDSWFAIPAGGASVSVDTSLANPFGATFKITSVVSTGTIEFISRCFPVRENETYYVSFWGMRDAVATVGAYLGFQAHEGKTADGFISNADAVGTGGKGRQFLLNNFTLPTTWAFYEYTVTAPVGAKYASLAFYHNVNSNSIYVSNITCREQASALQSKTFLDGGNLVTNPQFSAPSNPAQTAVRIASMAGWNVAQSAGFGPIVSVARTGSSPQSICPAQFMAMMAGGSAAALFSSYVECRGSEKFYASFDIAMANVAAAGLTMYVIYQNADGTNSNVATAITPTGSWVHHDYTITLPSTAAQARLQFTRATAGTAGQDIYITNASLERHITAARLPAASAVFLPSGPTHTTGIVPDPGATAGTVKFLCENATWAVPSGTGTGVANAYTKIGDATTADVAFSSGVDRLRFRSSDFTCNVAVQSDDATYGDNVAINVNTAVIATQSYVTTALGSYSLSSHTHTFDAGISDVVLTAPATGALLKYDGANWVNGLGIVDTATAERLTVDTTAITVGRAGATYTIQNRDNAFSTIVSGGTAAGAGGNVALYGGAHATNLDWGELRSSTAVLLRWTPTQVRSFQAHLFEDGTAVTAPGITFTSDLDTGLWRSAANVVNVVTGGAARLTLSTSNITATLPVTVPDPPTSGAHAASKNYVDSKIWTKATTVAERAAKAAAGEQLSLYDWGMVNDYNEATGTGTDNTAAMTTCLKEMMENFYDVYVPPGPGFYLASQAVYAFGTAPTVTDPRKGRLFGAGMPESSKIVVGSTAGGISVTKRNSVGVFILGIQGITFNTTCENAGSAIRIVHDVVPAVKAYSEVIISDCVFGVEVPLEGKFYYWGDFACHVSGFSRPNITNCVHEQGDYANTSGGTSPIYTPPEDPSGNDHNASNYRPQDMHDKYYRFAGQGGFKLWNSYGTITDNISSNGGRHAILYGFDPNMEPEGPTHFRPISAGYNQIGLRWAAPKQYQPGGFVGNTGGHLHARDYNFIISGLMLTGDLVSRPTTTTLVVAAADVERLFYSDTVRVQATDLNSTTVIDLGAGASSSANAYSSPPHLLEITAGTNVGLFVTITGYASTTRLATISPPLTVKCDATSKYRITTGGTGFFNAWNIFLTGGAGYGQHRVVSSYDSATHTLTLAGAVSFGAQPANTGNPGPLTRYTLEPPDYDTYPGGNSRPHVFSMDFTGHDHDRSNTNIVGPDGKTTNGTDYGIEYPTDIWAPGAKELWVSECTFTGAGPVWEPTHRRIVHVRNQGVDDPLIFTNNKVRASVQHVVYNTDAATPIDEHGNTYKSPPAAPFCRGDFVVSGTCPPLVSCFHTGGSTAISATAGTDKQPASTLTYVCQVYVSRAMPCMGIAFLSGSVFGNQVKLALADSTGHILAITAITNLVAANSYQSIPFDTGYGYGLIEGTYYVLLKMNGTTATRFRAHAVGCFNAGTVAQSYAAAWTDITPPTTFTADFGPIASLY